MKKLMVLLSSLIVLLAFGLIAAAQKHESEETHCLQMVEASYHKAVEQEMCALQALAASFVLDGVTPDSAQWDELQATVESYDQLSPYYQPVGYEEVLPQFAVLLSQLDSQEWVNYTANWRADITQNNGEQQLTASYWDTESGLEVELEVAKNGPEEQPYLDLTFRQDTARIYMACSLEALEVMSVSNTISGYDIGLFLAEPENIFEFCFVTGYGFEPETFYGYGFLLDATAG